MAQIGPMLLAVAMAVFTTYAAAQSCDAPLGISDGSIPDSSLAASSTQRWHDPFLARLNQQKGAGAWCSEENNPTPPRIWVDLGKPYRVTKIAIQGRNSSYSGMFTRKFRLYYMLSADQGLKQEFSAEADGAFTANTDKTTVVYNTVDLIGQTVTILPIAYYPTKMACLRFELYGCPHIVDPCQNNGPCDQNCTAVAGKAECSCYAGYAMVNGKCQDINECTTGTNKCDAATTTCVNNNGGYTCQCKLSGTMNDPGNVYACIDINECDVGNGGCAHKCHNTFRSYYCTCNDGYKLQADNKTCIDEDECALQTDKCDKATTQCRNTPGSYACDCSKTGFEKDPQNKFRCIDIDECARGTDTCDKFASKCENTIGGYNCRCKTGWSQDPSDTRKCVDINECLVNNGGCEQNCHNIDGSFTCTCGNGYRANGLKCEDIDECANAPCDNYNGICQNTIGSYICSCKQGYELKPGTVTCQDIDECARGTATCRANSNCVNSIGSYTCPCNHGFTEDASSNCVASHCQPLKHITNGKVSPPRCLQAAANSDQDVCMYTCDPGYELKQGSARSSMCNSESNWVYQSGSTPFCERIRCPAFTVPASSSVVPAECYGSGAQYETLCQVYCNGGLSLVGTQSASCQADGSMSADLSISRCVQAPTVKCPADVITTLPTGAKSMKIPMPLYETNMAAQRVTSDPAGALAGTFDYPNGRTLVKLIAKNEAGVAAQCTYAVDTVDREAPTVHNCPTASLHIPITGKEAKITWQVPTFTDNIGVVKSAHNLDVGVTRPAATYFASYSARDAQNNVAYCEFFIHVEAKYCSVSQAPGGDGASLFPTQNSAVRTTVFVSCPHDKRASFVSPHFSYVCNSGVWTPNKIPDCVGFTAVPASGDCPAGTRKLALNTGTTCVNCPKGTHYNATTKDCVDCATGYYQFAEKSLTCAKCPTGTTTIEKGSKDQTLCRAQCSPGSYSIDGFNDAKGCDLCPLGHYQPDHGKTECIACADKGVTLQTGSTAASACIVPAKIIKVTPSDEIVSAVEGDTVTIDCLASGVPKPLVSIRNATVLAPVGFRGTAKRLPLQVQGANEVGLKLEISNVQVGDTARYNCTADNRQGQAGAIAARSFRVEVRRKNGT